jgi:hypothetical protein
MPSTSWPKLRSQDRVGVSVLGVALDVAATHRQRTVTPLVVTRSRHLEHPVGGRDVDAVVGQLTEQPEPYFGSACSLAKNAKARLRISS